MFNRRHQTKFRKYQVIFCFVLSFSFDPSKEKCKFFILSFVGKTSIEVTLSTKWYQQIALSHNTKTENCRKFKFDIFTPRWQLSFGL